MFPERSTAAALLLLSVSAAGAAAGPIEDAALARIAALTKTFQGTVVLHARNLRTGATLSVDAEAKVRTASTIKLPILCALEALVAKGDVRWDERIVLRDAAKVSGSGVLHELADGTALTMRDLARLMIVVSDNTATNLILDRITADAVNAWLDTVGLTATRSLRKIRGDGTDLVAASGWSAAGKLPGNERYGIGVSTSREMVRLLEMLHEGTVVSPAASLSVLETLERQQFKDGIGRRAGDRRVQSKSGALDALRSDVGIIYTPGGPIAMAITVDGMPLIDYSPDNAGNELIWQMSQIVQDALGRP
jgi:beta-lactamase class A